MPALTDVVVVEFATGVAGPYCGRLLSDLGAQVFMTGADPLAFAEIADRAQIFEVTPGQARVRS